MPTEKQQKFLEALFGEAKGDLKLAKDLAGYSKNTRVDEVTQGLEETIVDLTKKYIANNGPKAVFAVQDIIDQPTALGNRERLAAAKDFLDRAGFKQSEKVEVKTDNPIFVLPAKE